MSANRAGKNAVFATYRKNANVYLPLLLLCAVSVALTLSFYYGPDPSYAPNGYLYVVDAHTLALPGGAASILMYDATLGPRFIMIGAITLFTHLFGARRLSEVMFDVVCFVGTDILIFLLGAELYSRRAGLIGALLYSFFPLVVFDAFGVGDDAPMAFFAALSVFLFLVALRQMARPRRRILLALSGFIPVIGFMVTPEEVLVLPVLFALFVIYRKSVKRADLFAFFLAIAFAILIMAFISVVLSNSPLTIYKSNSASISDFCVNIGSCGNYSPVFMYLNDMLPGGVSSFNQLMAYLHVNSSIGPIGSYDSTSHYYYGFFFYAALIAAAYLVLRREKKALVLGVWSVLLLLYLFFGTTSLTHYTDGVWYPLPRYTLIVWPALMLIIGCAMDSLMTSVEKNRRRRRKTAVALRGAVYLVLAVFLAALFVQSFNSVRTLGYQQYGQVYELIEAGNYVNQLPYNATVYSGYNMPVQAYTNMQDSIYAVYSQPKCSDLANDSYLVLPRNGTFAALCGLEPVYSAPPPASGTDVFQQYDDSYLGYKNITVYYKR